MNPLRLVIGGATGRMGRALARLAAADARFQIVGAVTLASDTLLGRDAGEVAGVGWLGVPLSDTAPSGADAVIEFTLPAGTAAWAAWCRDHGVALVSGTTGLEVEQWATLDAAAARVGVVWAANMSIGANLLLAVVQDVASQLGVEWDVEIEETHHRRKVDAPSGTALALLAAVQRGRGTASGPVRHGRQGNVGARPAGEIGMHAIRLGSVVGEHHVHFASEAEIVTLTHRAASRDAFALGALRAALWLQGRAPGLYRMRDVLFG